MVNYWDNHGVFFLVFITVFPRLTLLFSSVAFGGFFWWIGFIFAPRVLVAILATLAYLQTNPILVIISWVVALSGESTEKYTLRKKVKVSQQRPRPAERMSDSEVIDVNYKRLD